MLLCYAPKHIQNVDPDSAINTRNFNASHAKAAASSHPDLAKNYTPHTARCQCAAAPKSRRAHAYCSSPCADMDSCMTGFAHALPSGIGRRYKNCRDLVTVKSYSSLFFETKRFIFFAVVFSKSSLRITTFFIFLKSGNFSLIRSTSSQIRSCSSCCV